MECKHLATRRPDGPLRRTVARRSRSSVTAFRSCPLAASDVRLQLNSRAGKDEGLPCRQRPSRPARLRRVASTSAAAGADWRGPMGVQRRWERVRTRAPRATRRHRAHSIQARPGRAWLDLRRRRFVASRRAGVAAATPEGGGADRAIDDAAGWRTQRAVLKAAPQYAYAREVRNLPAPQRGSS